MSPQQDAVNILGGLSQAISTFVQLGGVAADAVGGIVSLTAAFFDAQRAFVTMTTGFEVGLAPTLEAIAESIGAVHEQTRQTVAMGVQRQALFEKLDGTIAGLKGDVTQVFGLAIGFLQFGLGENMKASLEVANRLRLQGEQGGKLIKEFNILGRKLLMSQDSIDVLINAVDDGAKGQTITTAALLRFVEQTGKVIDAPAMLGMAPALMGVAAKAGEVLGAQGQQAFTGLLQQLSKFDAQSIIAKGQLGIGMGFIDKLAASSDPLQLLIDTMGGAENRFRGLMDSTLPYELKMQALTAHMGGDTGLARAVLEFDNAIKNAEAGVGALGDLTTGKGPKDIEDSLTRYQEELMNPLRITAMKIGQLQEENAEKISDSLNDAIIVVDGLMQEVLEPLLGPGGAENLITFTDSVSRQFATLTERLTGMLDVLTDDKVGIMGNILDGVTELNEFFINTLLPSLTGMLATLTSTYGNLIGLDPDQKAHVSAALAVGGGVSIIDEGDFSELVEIMRLFADTKGYDATRAEALFESMQTYQTDPDGVVNVSMDPDEIKAAVKAAFDIWRLTTAGAPGAN